MELEERVATLSTALVEAQTLIAQLQAQNAALEERLARYEGPLPPTSGAPAWAKPNKPRPDPAAPPRPQRPRAPEHNRGRRRSMPTRVEVHALERCPDCAYLLRGGSVVRRREVLEIPLQPLEVVEHQIIARVCPACAQRKTPVVSFAGVTLGQSRIGVRLASLIAYLRTHLRLPLAQLQTLLRRLYGLPLSRGGLVDLLRRVAARGAPAREEIVAQMRASPALHMDETGWRVNGQNGYLWVQATTGAQATRVLHFDHSRAGAVAQELLGSYDGVLCTDFYAAYNRYDGPQQRCWAHLWRALHDLKRAHPDDGSVQEWADAVGGLYGQAHEALTPLLSRGERRSLAQQLERRVWDLGRCYAYNDAHPAQTLAQRLLRYESTLFQFVRVPGVEATNNPAERAVRPQVIARKISGGSRSAQGIATRCALATLFETWQARALDPFHACLALLQSPAPPL